MEIPYFQIDAFTDTVFGGNPAGVCLLDDWLPAETMQAIALENNLSETVFLVADGDDYGIRWFTPTFEIDLAGHPTLAAGSLVLTRLDPGRAAVTFISPLGDVLTVTREDDRFAMDFPARPPEHRDGVDAIGPALGATPDEALASRDGFAVFADANKLCAKLKRRRQFCEASVMGG
jgi:PhzF family phenazine biosynthesis protein